MSQIYNRAAYLIANGGLDLDTDDIRCLLVGSGYTFNADHDYVADVVAQEVSDASYARKVIAGETVTLDDASDLAKFTSDAITWTALDGVTAKAAIFYKFVTNDADSPLVAYFDGADFPFTANGGDVTLTPDASGWLTLAAP